jgi:hypothetical protein
MLFSRCQRILMGTVAAIMALSVTVPSAAVAKPSKPGRPGGFRLFSTALTLFAANRVQCRIGSDGSICATGSSTVGGGIWPRGTADQYIFGSGINIAGIIEPGDKAVNGFAGDTAGAFFNNTAGTNNGTQVRPIFSSNDPEDAADWPDEARVPLGDASENLFDPTLRGAVAASQGDLWFVSWEGDASQLASRAHPLGVAVETRVMAWNFPAGNEDIMYVIYTFYNITSTDPAAYANVRPSLQPLLLEQAATFQAANSAKFGVALPPGGYAINDMFAAFTADMDVAQADINFASVNVPFSLGYTYENTFGNGADLGWTFDPAIFGSAPFFPGIGFIGVKYLGSPNDPVTGQPVGLTLFGTFSRSSGSLQDPGDDKQLYRYITGGLLSSDGACSLPNPLAAKICFVNISSPADMRFFQSSGPIDLPPGGFGSITVAYIFAAPVAFAGAGCPGPGCNVRPAASNADLTILGSASRMASGVNDIDRITGYLDFNDANADGIVTQDEFVVVPRSLLGKALVAQTVFDNKFLLPFAPERPDFFLVPGDNQVTVLWSKSATESTPDPFFAIASQPLNPDGTVNALYDPNFRPLDVEGYRVYRGRSSNPSELTLIAQFDFDTDPQGRGVFQDFRATMNPVPGCAPELGVVTTCPIAFSNPAPGSPFVGSVPVDLVGTITQVNPGNRVLLASGEAQILPGQQDTAFADISGGRVAQGVSTELTNSGVPYLYVDHNVRNSLRYFYSVVAFDVNSLTSGPSSLESARLTKPVTPTRDPSNFTSTSSAVKTAVGRGGPITGATPTLDATTGKFSGPFPGVSTDGFDLNFVTLVPQLAVGANSFSVRLDSIQLGEAGNGGIFGVSFPVDNRYFYTAQPETPDAFVFSASALQSSGGAAVAASAAPDSGEAFFETPTPVNPATAAHFEGAGGNFRVTGKITEILPSAVYLSGQGIGCNFGDEGFTTGGGCTYNGSRWFDGPSPTTNETLDHPNAGNTLTAAPTSFNNAGQLTGVTTIYELRSYLSMNNTWRNVDWSLSGAARAADFNVYWGAGGLIDSVIDASNNVVVPFDTVFGGGFGILNQAATTGPGSPDSLPGVLSPGDVSCVHPFITLSGVQGRMPCGDGTVALTPYKLSQTATLGPIAFYGGGGIRPSDPAATPPAANPGFMLYLPGHVYLMEMAALPAQGTVWAMRSYVGAITGGNGTDGDQGPYSFTPATSPFTALGVTAQATVQASTGTEEVQKNDLSGVHTVPDPYYVQSKFEVSTDQKVLKFVGLPQDAIIRIYSASGILVRMLEHHAQNYSSTAINQGSEIDWDLRNRNNQVVASGVYFFHVEAGGARRVGRFTVVNFAQ